MKSWSSGIRKEDCPGHEYFTSKNPLLHLYLKVWFQVLKRAYWGEQWGAVRKRLRTGWPFLQDLREGWAETDRPTARQPEMPLVCSSVWLYLCSASRLLIHLWSLREKARLISFLHMPSENASYDLHGTVWNQSWRKKFLTMVQMIGLDIYFRKILKVVYSLLLHDFPWVERSTTWHYCICRTKFIKAMPPLWSSS